MEANDKTAKINNIFNTIHFCNNIQQKYYLVISLYSTYSKWQSEHNTKILCHNILMTSAFMGTYDTKSFFYIPFSMHIA